MTNADAGPASHQMRIHPLLVLGLVCIAALLIVHYHSLENSPLRIHDTLESSFPHYLLLSQRPLFEPLDAIVPQIMGGVPIASLPSSLHLYAIPFRIMDPLYAYIFNDIIVRLAAFFGMICLLKNHIRPRLSSLAIYGASTCFALLDYWPPGYLTVMGIPLFLNAYLNIASKRFSPADWIVVFTFPFASLFVMIGWFLLPVCGLIYLKNAITDKHIRPYLLGSLALLTSGYLLVEHRLFYQALFNTDYASHRAEFDALHFDKIPTHTVGAFLRAIFDICVNGDIAQAPTFAYPYMPILLIWCVVVGIGVLCFEKRKSTGAGIQFAYETVGESTDRIIRTAIMLIFFIAFASIAWCVQYTYLAKQWMMTSSFGALSSLNLARIAWMIPVAWYVLFAISLELSAPFSLVTPKITLRLGSTVALLFVIAQISTPFLTYNMMVKGGKLYGKSTPAFLDRKWTYIDFYATDQLARIKLDIGIPPDQYRVGAIGLQPGILLYNGFHTAGGYLGNYPLEYKHRFRKLMSHELDLNRSNSEFFDRWGNKCYILPSQVPRYAIMAGISKRSIWVPPSISLKLDSDAMKDLGIDYFISSIEIENPLDSDIKLLNTYEDTTSPWIFYLYEAQTSKAAI